MYSSPAENFSKEAVDPMISSIRVLEGGPLNDDIGFDNISFVRAQITVPETNTLVLFTLGSLVVPVIAFIRRK